MNDDDFEKLLMELQQKVDYDEEKTYSKTVIKEYRNPSNFGVIEKPDAIGILKGSCNDTMKITLKIKKEVVTETSFWTDGCGATVAAGSMLTKMINGKTVYEAYNITDKKLTDTLGGLPKEHLHCSKLAVDTLKKAIQNYNKKNAIR